MKVAFRKFIPLIVAVSVGNFPTLVEAQLLSGVWPVKPPAPPAPPAQHQTGEKMERQSVAAEFYTVGDVTDEEQLYVEFINRARANPQAEAQLMANTTNPLVLQAYAHPRHGGYGVDLEMMLQAFALIPPVPPLALNARLNNAARKHSQDMLDQNLQTHTGSNGSSIGQRIEAEGYDWVNIAENVYAFSDSVEYGHFGFEVDWGPNPPSGMQDPPGHRLNIHNPVFKEIGVGMVYGQKPRTNMFSGVGPSLVSQEFATAQNSPAFVTGVVYYDFNGNNVYDVGEGLGNIQVSAAGVSTKAITAPSGGYSLPIPTDGVFTITFSGPGLPATIRSAIILNRQNVKIDFVPAYKEPIIQGPAEPLIGKGNIYTATDVAGGVSYQWSTFTRLPAVPSEGAENTNNITFNTPTNYVAVDASISKSGSRSFHLSHLEQLSPDQQVKDISQSFEVNNIMLARANSQVRFQSRLGFATTNQIARVLASSDNGQTWVPVYSQPGSMGSGEAGFNLRTASLSQFAGKLIRVRFSYDLEI
ncbi:MAG: CAP domain-containing protein, partial [Verrucomicrobiales bacterium]